jgi:transcription elongation factor Elf1
MVPRVLTRSGLACTAARPHAAACCHCRHRDSQSASALSSVVTEAWPHKSYTFRALRKTFGAMWVRCDVCRRYAPLSIAGLQEVDYRSKTFSCSQCGSEAYLAVIEPIKTSRSGTGVGGAGL